MATPLSGRKVEPSASKLDLQSSSSLIHWLTLAAFVWALLFGLTSLFWGGVAIWGSDAMISGRFGAGIIGKAIEQQALERQPSFIALLWITGVLKLCLCLVALALVRPWGRRLRRLWRLAAWVAGVGMILYGIGNGVEHLLMWSGAMATPEGLGEQAVGWHLALWDPWWLLGGVLFTYLSWMSVRNPVRS